MDLKKLSDEDLEMQLLSGNLIAFDEVYRRYYKLMLGIAISFVKDTSVAKDLLQEVFLSFYKIVYENRVVSSGGASGMKPLLARMTKNACIDVLRRNKRVSVINVENDQHFESVLFLCGKDQFDLSQMDVDERREEYQRVACAVSKLSKKQQTLIQLRFESGLSFLEISELEGESINTWLGRMGYALKNLRKSLGIHVKDSQD